MSVFSQLVDEMGGNDEVGGAFADTMHRQNTGVFGSEALNSIGRRMQWHLARRGLKIVYDNDLHRAAKKHFQDEHKTTSAKMAFRAIEPAPEPRSMTKQVFVSGRKLRCLECGCEMFDTRDDVHFKCTSCGEAYKGSK